MGLPSALRMTRTGEYAAVRNGGRARSGRLMTVAFLADEAPQLPVRFGFTVTKKIGNAVKRNQVKRWLREITRAAAPRMVGSGRLVTIPRPIAAKSSFQEIVAEWHYLTGKLGLLDSPSPPSP